MSHDLRSELAPTGTLRADINMAKFLTRHIEHAELVRAEGVNASYELFVNDNLEALAGLRPLDMQTLT